MISRFGAFLRSSIGKKALMAVTGLLLIGFLIVHVVGNLTLYADGDGTQFNAYAAKLEALGPLKVLAEVGLTVLFLAHIALGLRTALENREARPERYKDLAPKGRRTMASMTMVVTGAVLLVFLVIHVIDFRLADFSKVGLAKLVMERLTSPLGAGIYLVSMAFLGSHLWHAFQSLFQTLGLRHPSYAPTIKWVGSALALAIAGLFASFPVLCMMFEGQWPWS
ncbi:MAG: succinate dehydrogenase cytochrome b subunit [Planctomycetes bacterium]|nr:succinate dehydrogenase cytochrome b subunit [Planctomycetota bacterium]